MNVEVNGIVTPGHLAYCEFSLAFSDSTFLAWEALSERERVAWERAAVAGHQALDPCTSLRHPFLMPDEIDEDPSQDASVGLKLEFHFEGDADAAAFTRGFRQALSELAVCGA